MRIVSVGVMAWISAVSLSACYQSPERDALDGGEPVPRGDAAIDASERVDGDVPQPPLAVGRDIRDVAADRERVFWVEHGTRDDLGNHLQDGSLRARSLDGGPIETIATGLAGPVQLVVAATHAVLWLDLAQPVGSGAGSFRSLVRVSLADGAVEVIATGGSPYYASPCPTCAFAYEDRVYWNTADSALVALGPTGAAPTVIESNGGTPIWRPRVEAGFFYFVAAWSLFRAPLVGGEVEHLVDAPREFLERAHVVRSGGRWYAIESGYPDLYLTEIREDGTTWRLARVHAGDGYVWNLEFVDDHFATDPGSGGPTRLVGGLVADPMSARTLAVAPSPPVAWTAARTGIVWTDGSAIHLAPW